MKTQVQKGQVAHPSENVGFKEASFTSWQEITEEPQKLVIKWDDWTAV